MNLFDIKTEQQVLSALINNFVENSETFTLLEEQDFFEAVHKKWFKTVFQMNETGETISGETFSARLRLDGNDKQFLEMENYFGSANSTLELAKHIKNFSLLRKLQSTGKDIQAESADATNDSLELIEKYSNNLLSMMGFTKRNQPTLIGEIIPEIMDRIDKVHKGEVKTFGISCNLEAIDIMTGGFEAGQLYIIAARPSIGKTSLMLSIAKNISQHLPVLVFSMEMTTEEIALRLLSQISGVSYYNLKNGHLSQMDVVSYLKSADKLGKHDIYIDPTSGLSIYELRSKLKKMIVEKSIKCIFIDYLGLMSTPKMQTRDLEIGYITRSLKQIAKEENIPIVLLSQLNRQVESRSDKTPVLSDLRESGNIEQDADVVLFIHRDKTDFKDEQTAEIIVAKNRNGAIGSREISFLKQSMAFANISHHEEF